MNVCEEFRNNYVVHLKAAVPKSLCNEWVADYFARTSVIESDPDTFPNDGSIFSKKTRSIPVKDASPVTWEVICELLNGEDLIDERTRLFSNNFNLNS